MLLHKQVVLSFNTQPRGGGCFDASRVVPVANVSTHSRAEAAAKKSEPIIKLSTSFNTQPRGGGCSKRQKC